jgi:hypothetical protein
LVPLANKAGGVIAMATPEHSYLLKLHRAKHHIEMLNVEVLKWIDGDNCTIRIEPDINDIPQFFIKATIKPLPVYPVSLIIGDAIQNMRSALDHMALAMARRYTGALAEKVEKRSQFPIIGDKGADGNLGAGPERWQEIGIQSISAIDPKAQIIIERLQPYHKGGDFERHPLFALNYLSNLDKHRALHIGCNVHKGTIISPYNSVNCKFAPGPIHIYEGRVTTDTVVAKIPLAPAITNPNLAMHLECKPAMFIGFEGGLYADKNVGVVIEHIYEYVTNEVVPRLAPFI